LALIKVSIGDRFCEMHSLGQELGVGGRWHRLAGFV